MLDIYNTMSVPYNFINPEFFQWYKLHGPVLMQFQPTLSSVLVNIFSSFIRSMVQFQPGSFQFWTSVSPILVHILSSFSQVMVQFQSSSIPILVWLWPSFSSALVQILSNSSSVMAQFQQCIFSSGIIQFHSSFPANLVQIQVNLSIALSKVYRIYITFSPNL